jgi:outer membrane protein TolC
MRQFVMLCVLAIPAGASHAQQPVPRPTRADSSTLRDTGAAVRIIGRPTGPLPTDTADLVRQLSAARAPAVAMVSSDTARRSMDTLRLTREEAIAQALANNPQLDVAREQTIEARAQRVSTLGIPDPIGSGSITNQAGAPSYKPITASINIPFLDKFRLQYNIGTAGVRAAEYNFTAVRQQLASQTAQTYDSLRVALRHRTDLTDSRQLAADFLQKTQARYNAGTAAKLDVVRAQVNLAQADNALISNALAIETARASLNRLIARPLPTPVTPADTLAVPPPLPDLAPLETHALQSRPELAGLRAQQAGASANTTLTAEYWLPDLFFAISKDYGAPDPYIPNKNVVWQYGLSLPIPIFFLAHTSGDLSAARHHERELAASYRDLFAQVDQDVRATYATAATSLQQLLYLRDAVLPQAREEYRIASTSYSLGGSSALDVLSARTDLVAAESQYTDALAAADAAQADLERAAAAPLSQFRTGAAHGR